MVLTYDNNDQPKQTTKQKRVKIELQILTLTLSKKTMTQTRMWTKKVKFKTN